MYVVIEMQTTDGVTAVVPPVAFDDLNHAYQKFYTVLSAAAVSNVPLHSAVIINDRGELIRTESFDHTVTTEAETAEEV